MGVISYGPWNANDLFDISLKSKNNVKRPLSFFNVEFKNRPIQNNNETQPEITKEILTGCGIYSLYYKKKLIYIGSYVGNNDVRTERWNHHLSSISMRGYDLNISRALLKKILNDEMELYGETKLDLLTKIKDEVDINEQQRLYDRQDEIYKINAKDRKEDEKTEYKRINKLCLSVKGGAQVTSQNRLLFANFFWDNFKGKNNENNDDVKEVFNDFEFYYVRDSASPLKVKDEYKNKESYKVIVKNIEKELIQSFNTFVNNEYIGSSIKLVNDNVDDVQGKIISLFGKSC